MLCMGLIFSSMPLQRLIPHSFQLHTAQPTDGSLCKTGEVNLGLSATCLSIHVHIVKIAF